MQTPDRRTITRGGAWLLDDTEPAAVLSPERLSDEHTMIGQAAAEFVDAEVLPLVDRLEQKDWTLSRQLLVACGGLGFLGANVAEAHGGLALDKVSSLLVAEQISRCASFGATFGAQVNLVITPIALFGTPAQQARYLPRLVAGELVGAYCLSEAGAGSDALGARCRATRQADGGYVLSGEKMWITNGGFADLFIVFAKVDGEQFTAFIVERAWTGVTSGREEHKLGLHGSSTTPVILQDVHVPADAVLGEVGKGHKVAFNVLNFGRFKLGAMCSGGAKGAIAEAARYAAGRKQFGMPIASFGAIRHKLGEMTAREYALESVMYRTAGLIDASVADASPSEQGARTLAALEEFSVEASIAKVFGSEVLDYVLDENVQIHGGNGFVRDYPAERHYRDARVNRIFEGTNEINRLLISGRLIKKAEKGELPLAAAARALQDELLGPPAAIDVDDDDPLAAVQRTVHACKKVMLLVAGAALQRFGAAIRDEQEVLGELADIAIDTYAAESSLLRARAAAGHGIDASRHQDAARVCVNDAAGRIELAARRLIAAVGEGDTLRVHAAALRRLLKPPLLDTIPMRRRLADAAVEAGGYPFGK